MKQLGIISKIYNQLQTDHKKCIRIRMPINALKSDEMDTREPTNSKLASCLNELFEMPSKKEESKYEI